MSQKSGRSSAPKNPRPPFERIALMLQGGGALGAYQGGVYQALTEFHLQPDWVAGISIGAINAAIIAGNPPDARVAQLRKFWEGITSPSLLGTMTEFGSGAFPGVAARSLFNNASATAAMLAGVNGFFTPRFPSPLFEPSGSATATSYYDTSPLLATLEALVDFDRINSGEMRFSAGAVDVKTGNFACFDSTEIKIGPAHILASGALPPGFPAIEIGGEHYWDGGLVSNTPLQWVLQYGQREDTLAFQVDLWSSEGKLPRNMSEVATRQKEIMYSSRTRENTDRFMHDQLARHAVAKLIASLPEEVKDAPDVAALRAYCDRKVYNIVHLIYRAKQYEGDSKDYEFSRLSMIGHWDQGYRDTVRTLHHPGVLARPVNADGLSVYDCVCDDHD